MPIDHSSFQFIFLRKRFFLLQRTDMIGLSGTEKTDVSLTKTAALLAFLEDEFTTLIRKKMNHFSCWWCTWKCSVAMLMASTVIADSFHEFVSPCFALPLFLPVFFGLTRDIDTNLWITWVGCPFTNALTPNCLYKEGDVQVSSPGQFFWDLISTNDQQNVW